MKVCNSKEQGKRASGLSGIHASLFLTPGISREFQGCHRHGRDSPMLDVGPGQGELAAH